MMTVKRKCLLLFCFLWSGILPAQWNGFNYRRPVDVNTQGWNAFLLPVEIFSHLHPDLGDLRLYQINSRNDTAEVPYILKSLRAEENIDTVQFDLINRTRKGGNRYYTFKRIGDGTINSILLSVSARNFDVQVDLQGSNDQQEWFTIGDQFRILSIENTQTSYVFTGLYFDDTDYRFYRLSVPGEDIGIESAAMYRRVKLNGHRMIVSSGLVKVEDNKVEQRSVWTCTLPYKIPVNSFHAFFPAGKNFYRTFTAEYLADSVETPKGLKYDFLPLVAGTFNSADQRDFQCPTVTGDRFRFTVNNYNDQPVHPDSILFYGDQYQLIFKGSGSGTYYLYYGSQQMSVPVYDLTRFTKDVPDSFPPLSAGKEEMLKAAKISGDAGESKTWLWVVMIVAVLVMGGFTIRMMKSGNE